MKWKIMLSMFAAALIALPATGFAQDKGEEAPAEAPAKKDAKPKAKPSNDAHALSGTWQSEWGEVVIVVQGQKVMGSWKGGTFEGEFDDRDVIHYSWTQPPTKKGEKEIVGKGYFEIIQQEGDQRKLMGTWGFGAHTSNGGAWTLYGQAD